MKTTDIQPRGANRVTPPQSPQPGGKFGEGKRLGEVIVCSGIQPSNAVIDGVSGGEEEDRDALR